MEAVFSFTFNPVYAIIFIQNLCEKTQFLDDGD